MDKFTKNMKLLARVAEERENSLNESRNNSSYEKWSPEEASNAHDKAVSHIIKHENGQSDMRDTSHSIITHDPMTDKHHIQVKSKHGNHGSFSFNRGKNITNIKHDPDQHHIKTDNIVGGVTNKGKGFGSDD